MKSICLAASLLAFAAPAVAAPLCDTRENVTALLADSYGETVRVSGLAGETALMELFASDETGTWSITMTLPDGMMCLMASGTLFVATPEARLPANL